MTDPGRYFDPDPAPRRSPRLLAEMGAVPGSVLPASLRPTKLTPAQLDRLRRDMAILSAIERGMSQRMAAKVFKMSKSGLLHAYRRISRRKSRV